MKLKLFAFAVFTAAVLFLASCGGPSNPATPDDEPTLPVLPWITGTPTPTVTAEAGAATAATTMTASATHDETAEESFTPTCTDTPYIDDTATLTPTQVTADSYEPNESEAACVPVNADTFYEASIYPLYDNDWYCFHLSAAAAVSFSVRPSVNGTGINPVVYDESMNYVFGEYVTVSDGSGETQIRYAEIPAGNYYIQVIDFMNFGTMGYTLRAALAGSPDFTATPTFTFAAVDSETLTHTPSYEFTATPTCSLTMTSTETQEEPSFTATLTETEIIYPDAYEFDDGCGFSNPIGTNECQDRTIDGTDIDWLTLAVSQHSLVTVVTSGGAEGDTILDFYSTDCGGLLANDDDSGSGLYSNVQLDLPPGIYGIRVTARPQAAGGLYPYRICVSSDVFTPTFTVTVTVTPTFTRTVTLTYTVTNTAQDTATLTVTPTVTVTMTFTLSPTATETALPGTVWTQAVEHAGFSERAEFGLVVFNRGGGDKMFVTGGDPSSSGLNDVFESADGIVWNEITQVNPYTKRSTHLTLVFDSRLWVIGGEAITAKSDIWYTYDGADWSAASTMTALGNRTSHAGAVFDPGSGERMYVIGGFKNGVMGSDVYSSQDGAAWSQVASSSAFGSRYGHRAAAFDGKLWVSGGIDTYGGTCKNDVWYSTDGASWTAATLNAAFSPRYRHVMFAANGRLWIIGGDNDTDIFQDSWYSYDGAAWTKSADSNVLARRSAQGISFAGKMWLIGGATKYNYTYGDEVLWSY